MGEGPIKPSLGEVSAVQRDLAHVARANDLDTPVVELDGCTRRPQAHHATGAVRVPPRFAVGFTTDLAARRAALAWALADLQQGDRPLWRRVAGVFRAPIGLLAAGFTVMAVVPRMYGQDDVVSLFPGVAGWALLLLTAGAHHVWESQRGDEVDTRQHSFLAATHEEAEQGGGE